MVYYRKGINNALNRGCDIYLTLASLATSNKSLINQYKKVSGNKIQFRTININE